MADVKIPHPEVGLAAFEVLDDYTAGLLISGHFPPLAPGYPMAVAADQALKQFEVVGYDEDGALVPATYAADYEVGGVRPIGISSQAVTGAANGSTTVPLIFSGCFNPDALVWDASFNTAEKKRDAFFGAPTPTQIMVRARG